MIPTEKKDTRKKSDKPSGGQLLHQSKTLQKVEDPDEIEMIAIDRRTLPKGSYTEDGFETRQVFDIDISRIVTEYQAQRLINEQGKCFVAPFPKKVSKAVQYGDGIKAHAVYLSQYQLLPYKRIQEYFADQLQMPISECSLFNFNQQAYEQLAEFEMISKEKLIAPPLFHADEMGININGKGYWLRSASNPQWTHFSPHARRGTVAMNEINILPHYGGILCLDHWKPYYKYDCTHSLCNAHHLRELNRAWEQDKQAWAHEMKQLLEDINKAVNNAGGVLLNEEVKELKLSNPRDYDIKPIEVKTLANTGALHLCIPQHLYIQLDLTESEKREATMADGSKHLCPYVGPIEIKFKNRTCFTGTLVLGDEVC